MLSDHHPRKQMLSFKYAFEGIVFVFKTQANFRVHLIATSTVCSFAYILGFSRIEWLVLILVITFVWVLEMINTIFEQLVDHLWQDEHPRAKVIKDVAAGTVLIGALGAAIVGAFLFIPYLL